MKSKTKILRSVYLYTVSLIGLITFVFALIKGSNVLIDILLKNSQGYVYSNLFSSVFAIIGGLFVFLFHWKIVTNERNTGSPAKNDEDFWASLFFYIVSFVGIMIVLFSFINFGSNIVKADYHYPTVKPGAKNPPKPNVTYYTDIRGMIKSTVSFIIGLFVWLLPYSKVRNKNKEVVSGNES